jgi:signal transduction histidine kinase
MKRTWVTWPVVGGVVLLLTVLLALQYRWQVKAATAEREIMQKRVEADARRFADEFNREVQSVYFNFQMDAEAWKLSDWTEFNERYDFWRSRTIYPEVVKDFYYWQPASETFIRYDRNGRTFAPAEVPEDLAAVRKLASEAGTFKPFYVEQFAMALPVHSPGHGLERIRIKARRSDEPQVIEMPARDGYLFIQLDRNIVIEKILPALAAKYFPNGDFKLDVRDREQVSVFQTAGDISASDAAESLLTFEPENMIFFSNKMTLPRHTQKESGVIVDQHIESRTLITPNPDANSAKTFTLEIDDGGKRKRAATFTAKAGDSDGWTLGIQHASGSVEAFIDADQNRKLATGLAIYLLVVGAIVAIAFSAMRSQKFAQRQIDFVSSVSHEFRTPLAVIYSAGENLADGVAKDETQVERYGSLIKSEGRKLSAMVEQILEFAGARSGRRKFSFERTDVNEIIKRTISECETDLVKDGFVVEKDLSERLPIINADPDALSSAIQNLIQNAVKYSNGNKWIQVGTFVRNGGVAIEVADKGIGISPADMNKIFEPFYRAKDVVDAQIHGNGLGLSLVKEIAEAHGGTVTAESEEGKGSKFTISLPLSEPHA